MKRLNKSILVLASLIFAITVNAQNKCTVNYGTNNYFTVKSSRNIDLEQKGDNVITGRAILPKITSKKVQTETYSLTICPEGPWSIIEIGKLDFSYYNSAFFPDCVQDTVEEGEYEVYVHGQDENGMLFWSTYLLSIVSDTTFRPTASADATHEISVIGVDENGQSLAEKEIELLYYDITFHWALNNDFGFFLCGHEYPNLIEGFRYNDLTDNDRVSVYAWMATEGQKFYFIEYPAIVGSDYINWTVENNAEDMKLHEESFSVTGENEKYYYVDYSQFIRGEAYLDGIGIVSAHGFDDHVSFNPVRPVTIATNINAGNENEFENGEIKIKLSPCVFNEAPEEEPEDKVMASQMWYDSEGNLIREPLGEFVEQYFLTHDNTPNYFERTPASNLYLDKEVTYGERTPIAYFQSYNYNESTSPSGYMFCEGMFLFLGEGGCQRIGDQDARIKVLLNDEEFIYDTLFNYNMTMFHFEPEDECEVKMDIVDKHLVCDGVEKYNHTNVIYDLHNDDATPPTLTILQILDEDNNEEVFLPEYKDCHINFAAGDFEAHIDELFGLIDHMQFFAKPNVEVYYSIENEEWTSLEFTEDEAMFHPNYGNFFTVDLSQMDAAIADKWVSLKFIVTDEAGNTQTQELGNVFYAGENVSVNEHTAESLQHSVYPNPFTNEVKINAAQAVNGTANIQVYNVLGEQVYSKTENCADTKEFGIDGSAWKPGVYFYSINTENGLLQGKIVKD